MGSHKTHILSDDTAHKAVVSAHDTAENEDGRYDKYRRIVSRTLCIVSAAQVLWRDAHLRTSGLSLNPPLRDHSSSIRRK